MQVKRETHTQYRHFNIRHNRNKEKKEKQISFLSNNKTQTLQQKIVQLRKHFISDLIIYIMESILGGWEGDFCFVSLFWLYF